jgi:hypothetical protein
MGKTKNKNPKASRVYALWPQNESFYPGTVMSRLKKGLYAVQFDDENVVATQIDDMRLDDLREGDMVEVSRDSVVVTSVDSGEVVVEQNGRKVDFPVPKEVVEEFWEDRHVEEGELICMYT